jgi:hypothetical protein
VDKLFKEKKENIVSNKLSQFELEDDEFEGLEIFSDEFQKRFENRDKDYVKVFTKELRRLHNAD